MCRAGERVAARVSPPKFLDLFPGNTISCTCTCTLHLHAHAHTSYTQTVSRSSFFFLSPPPPLPLLPSMSTDTRMDLTLGTIHAPHARATHLAFARN